MTQRFWLISLCTVAPAAAEDTFVGTWKLNVAKSKFSPGPAPQSQTVTIGADNKVEVSGTDSEGQAVNWSYTATPGPQQSRSSLWDRLTSRLRARASSEALPEKERGNGKTSINRVD